MDWCDVDIYWIVHALLGFFLKKKERCLPACLLACLLAGVVEDLNLAVEDCVR